MLISCRLFALRPYMRRVVDPLKEVPAFESDRLREPNEDSIDPLGSVSVTTILLTQFEHAEVTDTHRYQKPAMNDLDQA